MDTKSIKRIVVKIGSHSLVHPRTGRIDFIKLERLVMELSDLKNQGLDVCLVSSGAIAAGRMVAGDADKEDVMTKQALASIGQARLMSIYQKYFTEYNQLCGQVLITKNAMRAEKSESNAKNAFEKLFEMNAIPVVNANDTVSTYEIRFGDNDTLSAIVASLVEADLLIVLTDIDGLYSADPREDENAQLIRHVSRIDDELFSMASDKPGSDMGTGGMITKLKAARIATAGGCSMIITNGSDVSVLHEIFEGDYTGTLFDANRDESFDLFAVLRTVETEG